MLPYTPDVWIVEVDTKVRYETSFIPQFYKPPVLRSLAEISADILALEQETEGLLSEIVNAIASRGCRPMLKAALYTGPSALYIAGHVEHGRKRRSHLRAELD